MAASTNLTPSERTLRARKAAHVRHAKHDSYAHAAKMRAAFDQRFYDEVDPERVLPEAERERRAEHARKAYFADLAFKSAKARRAKAQEAADEAS